MIKSFNFLTYLILANCLLISNLSAETDSLINNKSINQFIHAPNEFMDNLDKHDYKFFGLAKFYNKKNFYIYGQDGLKRILPSQKIILKNEEKLIIAKRYNFVVLNAPDATIGIYKKKIKYVSNLDLKNSSISVIDYAERDAIQLLSLLKEIRYSSLVFPLNKFSAFIENLLTFLNSFFKNFGVSIIFLAFLVKLALYPLSKALFRSQQKVIALSAEINPKLDEIKNLYEGEDRHFKILEMYKELGISQNFRIYPALIALIQLPILIAIFNTLGEMPQLLNQSFLWINDLSKTDMASSFSFFMPLLGNNLNILPIIMFIFIFLSGAISIDFKVNSQEKRKKIRHSILMSVTFFVIFYPFPAAMVLYWTASNFFNILQQKFLIKRNLFSF